MSSSMHSPDPPGVDPNASRAGELVGWSSAMMALSGLAIILRFISRYLVRGHDQGKIHLEDWLSLVATPFAWTMCVISIWGAYENNFGRHMSQSTPASLHRYLIGLWVFEQAYNFAITFAKLSIIALWWRIFDVKSCHICLTIVGILEIFWLVGSTLTQVFSCIPVAGSWDLSIPSQCIVLSRYWIGAAVPNITFDIILLVLPNFWIMRLSISKSQKFALCFIFMLGIFVTICSSLRLWQLILYNDQEQTDLTWVMVGPAIWSLVEGNLSVVCCCLPCMRPILRLLVHRRLSYGYNEPSNHSPGTRQPSTRRGRSDPARAAKSLPLETMQPAKTLDESPVSPQSEHDNWPLPPSATYATAVFPADRPHRYSSSHSNSNRSSAVPQSDYLRPGGATTWLNLSDTSNGGGTPRPVSEIRDSERLSTEAGESLGGISEMSYPGLYHHPDTVKDGRTGYAIV